MSSFGKYQVIHARFPKSRHPDTKKVGIRWVSGAKLDTDAVRLNDSGTKLTSMTPIKNSKSVI